ncbi:MAG: transposase [Thermoanaerobaculia bacterium]|nr:transposase [Thermoanaerobaculia bacterium]
MKTPKTWGTSRAVRLDVAYYPPGQPVHVVISTHGRQPFFREPKLAQTTFGLLSGDSDTLAACLMPDHLHWLLVIRNSLADQVKRFKQVSTHRARAWHHPGHLWQRSYFDRILRREESVESVARYILDNPVRRGLVETEEEYPYSVVRWER